MQLKYISAPEDRQLQSTTKWFHFSMVKCGIFIYYQYLNDANLLKIAQVLSYRLSFKTSQLSYQPIKEGSKKGRLSFS